VHGMFPSNNETSNVNLNEIINTTSQVKGHSELNSTKYKNLEINLSEMNITWDSTGVPGLFPSNNETSNVNLNEIINTTSQVKGHSESNSTKYYTWMELHVVNGPSILNDNGTRTFLTADEDIIKIRIYSKTCNPLLKDMIYPTNDVVIPAEYESFQDRMGKFSLYELMRINLSLR